MHAIRPLVAERADSVDPERTMLSLLWKNSFLRTVDCLSWDPRWTRANVAVHLVMPFFHSDSRSRSQIYATCYRPSPIQALGLIALSRCWIRGLCSQSRVHSFKLCLTLTFACLYIAVILQRSTGKVCSLHLARFLRLIFQTPIHPSSVTESLNRPDIQLFIIFLQNVSWNSTSSSCSLLIRPCVIVSRLAM